MACDTRHNSRPAFPVHDDGDSDCHIFLLDADGRIKKLPSVLYYDNYVTMTDQFVPGDNVQDTIYTDRNTGKPRVGAATTGTGGIY